MYDTHTEHAEAGLGAWSVAGGEPGTLVDPIAHCMSGILPSGSRLACRQAGSRTGLADCFRGTREAGRQAGWSAGSSAGSGSQSRRFTTSLERRMQTQSLTLPRLLQLSYP